MKWRIEPRSQSGIGVEQAGGGEHGETVETAMTCNKRAGGTCSGVGTADRCGGIQTMTNKGGEASQVRWENGSDRVRSRRLRDYREAGDGWQGVVSEEGASRCVATYGWIAEEGAGVARGIVRVRRPAKRRQNDEAEIRENEDIWQGEHQSIMVARANREHIDSPRMHRNTSLDAIW
ncbi:hypothetical protein BJ322DRAFT_1023024 [Thelephora terrestris]|uniref:Uncharacterized protein n=1 Tax=Thelephora terrestris TaxID=56493 RepID=A0A9P6L3X2_9AGAM|nr:hypothetical protein BJ322DRAFT_1023024 [Thelephora terrestris]